MFCLLFSLDAYGFISSLRSVLDPGCARRPISLTFTSDTDPSFPDTDQTELLSSPIIGTFPPPYLESVPVSPLTCELVTDLSRQTFRADRTGPAEVFEFAER